MRPLQAPYLSEKFADIAGTQMGDREAEARARARGLLESTAAAAIPGPPGTSLAASSIFSGLNAGISGAAGALAEGRPVASTALTSAFLGAALPPVIRGAGAGLARLTGRAAQAAAAPAEAAISSPAHVQRVIDALAEAKPLRGKQAEINRAIRASRIGRFVKVGEKTTGRKGAQQQMAQLKGEFQKVEFQPLNISPLDEDAMYDAVKTSLRGYDIPAAFTALRKLFGKAGGSVPTSSEISLLDEVFGPQLTKSILAKRASGRKVGEALLEAGGAVKSITATADLSAPLRQGFPLVGTREWRKAFGQMFRYAGSEKAVQQLEEEIAARPSYELMRDAGLAITSRGKDLAHREERFVSNLIEEVPVYGKIARASNRAYTGFLNKLRADTFDSILKDAGRAGIDPASVADATASYVNVTTGRGGLGMAERAAKVLNAGFFSPRFVSARIQQLNPGTYLAQPAPVRKAAIRNLLAMGSIAGTTAGLARLSGARIGTDPRNADFGKIRFGRTRFDLFGGVQQPIRLAAQIVSGKVVSSATGKELTLGEGYKPLTRYDIATRYLEQKEAPLLSLATTLLKGESGPKKLSFKTPAESEAVASEVAQRFIPLFMQDAKDVVAEWGPAGVAMAIPGGLGIGVQTYGEPAAPQVKSGGSRSAQRLLQGGTR